MFCSTMFFKVFDLFFKDGKNLYLYKFFTFIAKFNPENYFLFEIRKRNTNFSIFSSLLCFIIVDFTLKVHECRFENVLISQTSSFVNRFAWDIYQDSGSVCICTLFTRKISVSSIFLSKYFCVKRNQKSASLTLNGWGLAYIKYIHLHICQNFDIITTSHFWDMHIFDIWIFDNKYTETIEYLQKQVLVKKNKNCTSK